jgi:DNA helicase HerA-like ATPase
MRVISNKKLRQLIVIEEAHHIFKLQDKSVQIALDQLLREARKFGITLLLVTQNASDIPEDMLTQFQNKFSFRDSSDEETKYLDDKCCHVKLYGGKSEFIMKTVECPSLIDRPSKAQT